MTEEEKEKEGHDGGGKEGRGGEKEAWEQE